MKACTLILRNVRNVKKCLAALFILCILAVYCRLTYKTCSTSKSKTLIQDLCGLYRHGKVAGNMCHKLCSEEKFLFSHCGNNHVGKNVLIMHCQDCDSGGRPLTVVLKTLHILENWTEISDAYFQTSETSQSMINRGKETIVRQFQPIIDLSKQRDPLSYVWGQNLSNFVKARSGVFDTDKKITKVALQSILGLAKQEEYRAMIILKQAPFVPKLYGTCGPAYFVEFTPSLPYLGYVLFQGKLPEVLSLTPKLISWSHRAKVALQLLRLLEHLENLAPPLFMCDIRPHNFGLDQQQLVTVLDVDSLRYERIAPAGTVCSSDEDCSFITCKGSCNLTSNTCTKHPINGHLQVRHYMTGVTRKGALGYCEQCRPRSTAASLMRTLPACRYIFISDVQAFGLLRSPPSHVADELQQLLKECSLPSSSGQMTGKSDKILLEKMYSLLERSMS